MNNFPREVWNHEQLNNYPDWKQLTTATVLQNNQCRYINHHIIKTTGYSIEDLDKTLLSRIFPDKYYRAVLERYRSERKKQPNSSFETSINTKNGITRGWIFPTYASPWKRTSRKSHYKGYYRSQGGLKRKETSPELLQDHYGQQGNICFFTENSTINGLTNHSPLCFEKTGSLLKTSEWHWSMKKISRKRPGRKGL
jgi:PAS domain S-box-containing protein